MKEELYLDVGDWSLNPLVIAAKIQGSIFFVVALFLAWGYYQTYFYTSFFNANGLRFHKKT